MATKRYSKIGKPMIPREINGMKTLQDFWENALRTAPQKEAVSCKNISYTYQEADELCSRLAAGLMEATGQESPRIAVCLPNCLEYYLLYWALVKLNGIIIPINPWLKSDSIDAILATVSPAMILLKGQDDTELTKAIARHPEIPTFSLDGQAPSCPFASLLHGSHPLAAPHRASPEDVAIIMHTSGTTSAPKGAMMRHCDLMFNVRTTIYAQGFLESDRHLLVNPMFHCTALYSSLPAAACQCSMVEITDETQPDKLLQLIDNKQLTTFLTVPSILQRIVSYPQVTSYDLHTLRVIGYAGSFMPVKIVRALQELFPAIELHNFFGLTETISATHALGGSESLERPDSIGRPLPDVQCLLLDETGAPCPPGVIGELLFHRENVIPGYWGNPQKLQEALIEYNGQQWFRTGDLALVDSEGFTFIKGRKKEMIIVGGENVFASEVEAALMQLDAIREAAVIGVPATGVRESLGELIKAFIVLEPGQTLSETEIRKHCRKTLPSYKNPHLIQFMETLPRNPSGKILKKELK